MTRPRKDWILVWLLGVGEVLEGFHLSRVRLHTLGSEQCTIETDLWMPYSVFAAVEYNAILHRSLHQLDKVHILSWIA